MNFINHNEKLQILKAKMTYFVIDFPRRTLSPKRPGIQSACKIVNTSSFPQLQWLHNFSDHCSTQGRFKFNIPVSNNYFVFEDDVSKSGIFHKILNDSLFTFTKCCTLKKIFFENFTIFEHNIISVQAAQVLQCMSLRKKQLKIYSCFGDILRWKIAHTKQIKKT